MLIVLFIFHLVFVLHIQASLQENEERLMDHIFKFKNYSKIHRPVLNESKPLTVKVGFEVLQILSVDERMQRISIRAWFRLMWTNELLQWDPDKWYGIKRLKISPNTVWLPDILLYNQVDDILNRDDGNSKLLVLLDANGGCYWARPALFTTSCKMDVTNFPFDRQNCMLKFGSWIYDSSEIHLMHDNVSFIATSYVNSSEWHLPRIEHQFTTVAYKMHPFPFEYMIATYTIIRKSLYYLFNVIGPCVILMSIILLSFLFPPESGERVAITITILLVFTVFLQIISGSLPRTSESIPVLSLFYLTIMAESAFSLIATCIVLIVHHRGKEQGVQPLTDGVRKVFLGVLGRKLGVQQSNMRAYSFDDLKDLHNTNGVIKKHSNAELIDLNDTVKKSEMIRKWQGILNSHTETEIPALEISAETLQKILKEVEVITTSMQDKNNRDEIEEEWSLLAKVLDRLLVVVFFFLFLVTSIAILVPPYFQVYFEHE